MNEPHFSNPQPVSDLDQPNHDIWRKEVHSRVARFRTRRGRSLQGAFSMRFPFPPAEPAVATSEASAGAPSLELDVPAADDSRSTPVESELDSCSVDVAVADSPQLTSEPLAVAASADFTSPPVAIPDAPAPPESDTVESHAAVDASSPQIQHAEFAPPPVTQPPIMQPRPRPKRKVIAFPRQPGTADSSHRLADPVLPEPPRILDVPEELEAYPSTPFLEGLQFEATFDVAAAPAVPVDHVELPSQPAHILQRIYAALLDLSVVAFAAVVFAFIGHKMLPDLVLTKLVRLGAALVALLLWAIYQCLLLVYAGKTVGMQVVGIRLSTFKGHHPVTRQRRNRVLGLYLSAASLAMGLLWAFVDVDSLCWHDRISGTYPTKRE